jgi:hypothetical protein
MSRLTGSEFREMIEAYYAVYAPKINEEQIQEDFENWVYSLVDEGEDLSEYTWDEMYEAYNYINEQSARSEIGGGLLDPIGLAAAGVGLAGMAKDAIGNTWNAAQTLMSRGKSQSKPAQGKTTRLPSPAAKPTKAETDIAKGQAAATAARSAAERNVEKLPTGTKPKVTVNNTQEPKSRVTSNTTGTSSSSSGGGTSRGPKPPEPPKGPNPLTQVATKVANTALQNAKNASTTVAKDVTSIPSTAVKSVYKPVMGALKSPPGAITATGAGLEATLGGDKSYVRKGASALGGALSTVKQKLYGDDKSSTPAAPKPTPTDQNKKAQLPVYNSYLFDLNNNEYINEAQVLGKKGKKWISVTTDASGKKTETEVSPTPQAIQRYNTLTAQKPKPKAPTAQERSDQKQLAADKQIDADVKAGRRVNPTEANPEGDPRKALKGTPGLDKALSHWKAQSSSKPADQQSSPNSRSSSSASQPVAKTPPTKPAIEKSPQGYAVGTTAGGTKFERRAATGEELRAAQAARAAAKASGNANGAEEAAVKAAVQRSQPTTGPAPTQAQMSDAGAAAKAAAAASKVKKESYDAYDLVLEYLFSQGHVDTLEEAHYVMMEMDSETIGTIVEGIADRAANAVGHQRAGTLGDDDEIRKNQDATSVSIGKMKRGSGAKVTPTLPGV